MAGLKHLADDGWKHRELAVARALLASDHDLLASPQGHGSVELADPQLRALQVGDQGKWPADRLLCFANEPHVLGVLLPAAVREVQPRRVHPGLDESPHAFCGPGRGTDRGDDFGSPRLGRDHSPSVAPRLRRDAPLDLFRARKVAELAPEAGERAPARKGRLWPELLFDPQELVVLRDPVAA